MSAIDLPGACVLIGGVDEVNRVLPSRAAKPAGAPIRVLAVEDEAVLRLLIELSLRRSGYRVSVAASGEEALCLWAEHKGEFEMLVTDVTLPGGVDGIEVIRRLRAERPSLRVVLTSGSGGDRILWGQNGGTRPEVVVKPYESADLVAAVQRALEAPGS